MSKYEITELERRVSNLIRIGVISSADYANAKIRVQVGDFITGWIPWLTQRAGGDISWEAPEVGEQVIVFSPSGELNQGIAMSGIFQTSSPAPVTTADKHHKTFSDGAVIEYDRSTHHLKAILPAGATTALTSNGGITIIGDITLTGNITMTGDVNLTGEMDMTGTLTADTDVIAGAGNISLVNHVHTDITVGLDDTGGPK